MFEGDDNWTSIKVPAGKLYTWDAKSTYVKNPPYFDGMTMTPPPLADVRGARVLALLGDSVTTDHISPAGNIAKTSPAARYLIEQGVEPADFNSYGARRGNHEVMMRGTFANIRLRNLLVPGVEGGVTVHLPSGEQGSIYDAAMRYKKEGTPLDRARRPGVRHRLLARLGGQGHDAARREGGDRRELRAHPPLQPHRHGRRARCSSSRGRTRSPWGSPGAKCSTIAGLSQRRCARSARSPRRPRRAQPIKFTARVRIDTPKEREYYRHGGILQYVLRQLAAAGSAA